MAEAEPERPKMHRWKLRGETQLTSDEGFPAMGSLHYLTWLEDLHGIIDPDAYLEIGTESGASLGLASCIAIAVDPRFRLQADVSRNKPELHQYQGTSDDFFASDLLGRLGYRIDLAFLDGMHLFEYLLRDFINMERHMSRRGLLTMHDCVPFNHLVAEREWDRRKTKSWTGDVWKLVPILRKYRPDLGIAVVDTPPTGLVCVTGLDPDSTVLADHYDQIVADWMDVTLDSYGLEQMVSDMDVVGHEAYTDWLKTSFRHEGAPARAALDDAAAGAAPGVSFLPADKITPIRAQDDTPLEFVIQTAVPRRINWPTWGDGAYADALARALRAQGHRATCRTADEWDAPSAPGAIDLALLGDRPARRRAGHPLLSWVLYFDDAGTVAQTYGQSDHLFCAGAGLLDRVRAECGGRASLLLQGFDAGVMGAAAPGGSAREGAVFVARQKRGPLRPIAAMALEAGVPLRLWGGGWDRVQEAAQIVAERAAPGDLGDIYRSAAVVLNDHRPDMSAHGIVSNRIFDALACGTPVISDPVAGLPETMAPFVWQVRSAAEMTAALAEIDALHRDAPARLADLAAMMTREHSFDARAAAIVAQAQIMTQHERREPA